MTSSAGGADADGAAQVPSFWRTVPSAQGAGPSTAGAGCAGAACSTGTVGSWAGGGSVSGGSPTIGGASVGGGVSSGGGGGGTSSSVVGSLPDWPAVLLSWATFSRGATSVGCSAAGNSVAGGWKTSIVSPSTLPDLFASGVSATL